MDNLEEENPIPKLELSLYTERKVWNNIFPQDSRPIPQKCVNYGKIFLLKENESLKS